MRIRSADYVRRLLLAVSLLLAPALAGASGKVVVGLPLEPPHLDPSSTSAEATEDIVYGNVYEGLTRIGENGETQSALAERWTVSTDGRHYVFFLRKGVRFHDGLPLTSRDVALTLEHARRADSVNPLHGLLAPIDAIHTPDDQTVEIDLSRPAADLPFVLGLGNLVIMSPVAVDPAVHPVGTGPFRFVEWRKGDAIVLKRNDDYWGPPAALEQVTFRIMPDATSALAGLLAGDVDAYPNFPAPETLRQLEQDPRFAVVVGSTEGETLLAINNARPPFDDVRVRRALAHAVDRKAIIQGAMYGYGTPIGSHFSPHDPAYLDLTDRYPYDPAVARKLLADAGLAAGFSVTLRLPPPMYARRSGEIIASQLGAIGIRVRIENIEWAQWLDQVFKRHDFDLTVVSHTEPRDYDIYARPDYYFGYHNILYSYRYSQLSYMLDAEQRRLALQDLQRQLADDSVNVWLFELPKLGVWKRGLKGLWREAPVQGSVMTGVHWESVSDTGAHSPAAHGGSTGWLWLALAGLAAGFVSLARRIGWRFFANRSMSLAATLLASSIVVFTLVQILPGDVASYMMGMNATPEALQRLRAELGLDLPIWRQYLEWIWAWCRADFGISYTYKVPVLDLVRERLSVSAPLALLALFLAAAIALPTALAGARRPGRRMDRVTAAVAQIGLAVPNYWLGLLLVLFFSVYLGWFPAGGFPGWERGLLALHHLWLPAFALAIPQACVLARILRTELGFVLEQDFIRTARAKGAGEWRVLWRHALPNALIPTLTVMGLQLSFLLAGAVIIETVFALPGIGRLIFQAAAQRDLMVIRSVVLLLVATVVCVNLGVELLWALIDPRLKPRSRT